MDAVDSTTTSVLLSLTVDQLRRFFAERHPNERIPATVSSRKRALINFLLENLPAFEVESLIASARERAAQSSRPSRMAQRERQQRNEHQHAINSDTFMELPTADEERRCYEDFYKATSNAAVQPTVCAVCARERLPSEHRLKRFHIDAIPNGDRLIPREPHANQETTEGMLLERAGIHVVHGMEMADICSSCLQSLMSRFVQPPRCSLANGLWTGNVPWELERLTISEQLLIAQLYSRIYVYKLYPKSTHAPRNPAGLMSAMKGSVTTYELNTSAIGDMLEGNLLPQRPAILAEIISVTLVGSVERCTPWIRKTFRVRRQMVKEALLWLKRNNPKYYGSVLVDADRLDALPENGVPTELLTTVASGSDDMQHDESDDYVPLEDDNRVDEDIRADVIPIDISGSLDTSQKNLTDSELYSSGLSALSSSTTEPVYRIRHGRRPVSLLPERHPRPYQPRGEAQLDNYFVKCFPCLFPYGYGAIEGDREVPLTLTEHVRVLLERCDHRFRKHPSFMFVVMGIVQRRQAMASARLQVNFAGSMVHARELQNITPEQFRVAQLEETQGQRVSDNTIRRLRRAVTASSGRVLGSDYARMSLRSQIWSTCIYMNPPSIWLTINPHDLHDPIAQVFVGAEIDLDNFSSDLGPSRQQRAENIASDPFGAAKYFQFMIKLIYEHLFGVEVVGSRVVSKYGIFGRVSAYFGSVESQGRGTLHLHSKLWLRDAPPAKTMEKRLLSPEFRDRIIKFLKANFRAYLPGFESLERVNRTPPNSDVAYSRPPNPFQFDVAEYERQLTGMEYRVARTQQLHTCMVGRCLVPKSTGYVCKRGAPFLRSSEYIVNEDGSWAVKRLCDRMNTWIPAITRNVRCNNDGKLITNGSGTKNLTQYLTLYATKKQKPTFNMISLLAKGHAYHTENTIAADDLRTKHRLLLNRVLNTINHEQEISGPLVASYLMGWNDVIRSHRYELIKWTSFAWHLKEAFPQLCISPREDGDDNVTSQRQRAKEDEQWTEVEKGPSDTVVLKSQVLDYRCRGEAFSHMSVMDFFVDTYEIMHGTRRTSLERGNLYLEPHPFAKKRGRRARPYDHNTLPNFVGERIPSSSDQSRHDYYCASILLLFKPWRQVTVDLKEPGQTWAMALAELLITSPRINEMVQGIQYRYECEAAAAASHNVQITTASSEQLGNMMQSLDGEDEIELGGHESANAILTETNDVLLEVHNEKPKFDEFASKAIDIGHSFAVFQDYKQQGLWPVTLSNTRTASAQDLQQLRTWQAAMEDIVDAMNSLEVETSRHEFEQGTVDTEQPDMRTLNHIEHHGEIDLLTNEMDVDWELNTEQQKAFRVVSDHLDQHLLGVEQRPLRLLMIGEGGTGKSRVIHAITDLFNRRGVAHKLQKTAYTGVAASLIEGKTTHAIGMISRASQNDISAQAKTTLRRFWEPIEYLVIDECSMLSKTHLAKLERHVSIGKDRGNDALGNYSFGGINIVLVGDFHQFPPVAMPAKETLYMNDPTDKDPNRAAGGMYYQEFDRVIILREQMRIIDSVWNTVLRDLRYGNVSERDLEVMESLVLGSPTCPDTNFSQEPWSSATLITSRQSVRHAWNEHAVQTHCAKTSVPLFVCNMENTINGELVSDEVNNILIRHKKSKKNANRDRRLEPTVHLAIGMKVMVTHNVDTDIDITNGARGIVVDIVLDGEEPPHGATESIIHLQRVPAYVLVKFERTRATVLPGLEESVIPIVPLSASSSVTIEGIQKRVHHRQIPLIPAYAYTDYKSQGQTLGHVLVDIATPPTGKFNLYNLYVAMSRSRGRETVRILRPFERRKLLERPDVNLQQEEDRLTKLSEGQQQ